jgi:alpha,alpha-trehalose phosphorylase
MKLITSDPLDRNRFPIDDWSLIETEFSGTDMGHTETLFAVGNGYVGLRGNHDEGRDGFDHGTFINGFHETWPIRHAEEAFGFARVGQTIVNAPDAKIVRLYVDDEPLVLSLADLHAYERRLDFRSGILSRELEWRTPSGKRVLVRSKRMASLTDRHLVMIDFEVTMLDADASVVLSSQILNRQDVPDEFNRGNRPQDTQFDPRKAEQFLERVLQPRLQRAERGRFMLGYRCTNSGMTLVCAAQHAIDTRNVVDESSQISDDLAKQVYRIKAKRGEPIRLTKMISYHTSRRVPTQELADRCERTLDRARAEGVEQAMVNQRNWLADFWTRCDVELAGQPVIQQATRWNLFQLCQATARADGQGIAAKGVTGSGYGGHYFWDTEVYVLPFLSYTSPTAARNALRFRRFILDDARVRAAELSQHGALFPWRTINGLESSAYYAAGTAQYHIDADIAYAITQYVAASGDEDFLAREGIDILVETARMWADLGFWRSNGGDVFHIHGVTGPDEYTTVVNDNLYTNVMARSNLRAAAGAVRRLLAVDRPAFGRMVNRLSLTMDEVEEWGRAAEAMHIPFDENLGIHPQDAQFLEKELWDLEHTPSDKHPLLLHYHPLVIYRFQVLKQADVVLALLLQGDQFTPEEKRANFEYYDPITTGDSTLSAVVQSIIAAEVGYKKLAYRYFMSALFVDLADTQGNASDGVHVASTGGVWSAFVYGFGGLRDHAGELTLDPRLPLAWESLTYRMAVKGTRVRIELRQTELTLTVEAGESARFTVRGQTIFVSKGEPVTVALSHQGPNLSGAPSASDFEGELRPDGTILTSSIPWIVPETSELLTDERLQTGEA